MSDVVRYVTLDEVVTMPGRGSHGNIPKNRWKAYETLKLKMGKTRAAKIANAGRTHLERSRMAKKAARTRKTRGGH